METKHRKYRLTLGLILVSIVIVTSACSLPPGDSSGTAPRQIETPETLPENPVSGAQIQGDAWFEDACEHIQFSPLTNFDVQQIPL